MKNKKEKQKTDEICRSGGISKSGWCVILAGVAVLIVGFMILTKTDPAGQNWASKLSPFLILGGFAIIGMGIVVPEKSISK